MKTKQNLARWGVFIFLTVSFLTGMAQGPYPNTGNQSVCLNSLQPYGVNSTPGSTYNWTIVPITGGNGTITGNGNSSITVLWTNVGTDTLKVVETLASGCIGLPVWIIITVNPIPDVAANPTAQSICSGGTTNIALSGTVPGTTFAWTAALTSGTATGFSNGSGSTIAQTLTNITNTLATVTYTITPTANNCDGTPIDVVVTVFPAVTVTATPTAQSICSGATTNIVLTSNTGTATFAWTAALTSGVASGFSNGTGSPIAQTLTNTSNALATVTYTITPTDNGCPGSPLDVVVTVYPVVTVTATPPAQSICSGATTNIALTSNTGTATFTWTAALTSGTATGFSNGSGSPIAQTLTNTTNTLATVTYTITPTDNGCPGTPIDVVVTVFPAVTVTATPPAQAICSGATTNIVLTSNTGTATFSWTAALTSGVASGFSNGTGSPIAQTLTNISNALATVTYTITPTDNGCDGTPIDVIVTVYPVVTVTATPPAQSICSGATTNIVLTSNTGTATFTWTAALTSGTASGFSNGSGSPIAQTLTNTTNTLATVTYTITPTDNGCPGTPIDVVVTVFPAVTVTATPSAQSICSGGTTNIVLTSNTGTATFTWTAALTSGTASGFSNGTGSPIAQTLINTTNTLATVTYTITPTDNGCDGTPIDVVVTVFPAVTVTATPPDQSICSGATTNIVLTSNTGTATFTWTAALTSGTASGFSNGSGSPIAQTLINTTNTLATVTYTVTPTDNGCPGTPIDVVVTVYPAVIATATPSAQAICSGGTTNIALTSNTGTATFTWTAALTSGTATGFSNGSGSTIAQTLFNATALPATVTYTITPSDNGCPGTPITVVVTVNPLPVPTITPTGDVCLNSTVTYSTESGMSNYVWTVTGGTFTGQGTDSIIVTWNTLGPQIITVTYTNTYGCDPLFPTSQTIQVNVLPNTSPIYHN